MTFAEPSLAAQEPAGNVPAATTRARRRLLSGFAEVSFEWIPRERNRAADRLANKAMDEGGRTPLPATSAASALPEASTRAAAVGYAPAQLPTSWTPPDGVPTRMIIPRPSISDSISAPRFVP